MCRVLGVTRSWYYAYSRRGATKRQRQDQALVPQIRVIFEGSDKTYGADRTTKALREQAIRVGKNRVWRLMRENDLVVKTRRRYKVTTNSDHKRPVAPNLVKQEFRAAAANRLWTGDVTCIRTAKGWLYLAVVLDVFSRRIVGWSMNRRMTDDLVLAAFEHAVTRRRPSSGFVFHSDRGSQYCSKRFRALVVAAGGMQSMSATGCCYDNAITESFFCTLKRELVHHCCFTTRQAARSTIFRYIEGFYNRKRIHSAIGYVSPEQFEQAYMKMAA